MKRTRTGFYLATLAAAILLLFQIAPSAFAQDRDDYDQDPPSRAGRVGYVQGSVSFQPDGQGDWLDAVPNRPLTTGDNLWADRDARAEVQIGSTSIRLGSETSITMLDLGDRTTQVRLSMGSLFFRVRRFGGNDAFEVDTPNLAFNVTQPGEYRIDVNENGDETRATVLRGDAEVTGGGDSYRLSEGQEGTFSGVDQLRYDVGEVREANDDFGRWCMSRDEREDRFRGGRYVSDEMTGYEDLDEYGRWRDDGQYGNVWYPSSVPAGWAPYRYGHWVYVSPWGWSWVEDEPWGFAPFHYGRWAFIGGAWGWVPGPVAVAPVYSPALVAFVGGGGFSVGVGVGGGGGVGWFPLAPGEVYVPWYRTSPRYVETVNVTNTRVTNVQVTNVYNNVTVNHVNNVTYVNQRVNNSVTVVNHETFVNARPVASNVIRVDSRQIASAPVTHEVVRNIQPERQSVIGNAHPVRMAPPQQVMTRPVVATRQPVVVNRPAPVAGMTRTTAPPPVRQVRAAPATQAQPLQRGARGSTAGGNGPANTGRPMPADNNRGAAQPGQPGNPNGRPGAPESNVRPGANDNNGPGRAPGANAPRPGAPQGTQMNQRGENAPRPNDNNNAARPDNNGPRPGNSNAPGAENNPRSNGSDNRPSNRNVPRPPSGQGQPGQPGQSGSYDQSRGRQDQQPSNARPEQTRPESPRTMPEEPARRNAGPDNGPPPSRNETAPPPSRTEPPPQSRRDTAPPPDRAPEARQPSRPPESRTEPAPRPEARPAQPPSQRESRPSESRSSDRGSSNDRGNKDKEKDKEPPKGKGR